MRDSRLLWLGLALSSACAQPREAPSVELPVMVDRSGLVTSNNDLGYEIQLSRARVVIENIAFAVDGEAHEHHEHVQQVGWMSWVFPVAYAHPGHFEGGEVTGELNGRFVLDWLAHHKTPQKVGTALLLYGRYTSANFRLGRGGAQDGLASSDPLFGHTALLSGVARKGEEKVNFVAVIDSPPGRQVLGIPFALEVNAATDAPLGFRLHTLGVIDEDSMFDGVDFAKLPLNEDGVAHIHGQTEDPTLRRAYARIRRSFQTQEQFDIKATTMKKLAKMAAQPPALFEPLSRGEG